MSMDCWSVQMKPKIKAFTWKCVPGFTTTCEQSSRISKEWILICCNNVILNLKRAHQPVLMHVSSNAVVLNIQNCLLLHQVHHLTPYHQAAILWVSKESFYHYSACLPSSVSPSPGNHLLSHWTIPMRRWSQNNDLSSCSFLMLWEWSDKDAFQRVHPKTQGYVYSSHAPAW